MNGLRILFISDLHVSRRTAGPDIDRLLRLMDSASPDLLLLGGDYADDDINSLRFIQALADFKAPMGIFAVLGNNDREAWPDISALRRHMEASGINLLVNESKALSVNNGKLIIAGIDEHKYGQPDCSGLYPQSSRNAYRILLSHYPCIPAVLPDLMLSGHTHGGQFNGFGFTPYTIGFERLLHRHRAPAVIAGLKPMNHGFMLVSKGVGASRIPLRIGVKPEINLLKFDC